MGAMQKAHYTWDATFQIATIKLPLSNSTKIDVLQ